MHKAYDEVADFIAVNNPRRVVAFRPSAKAKARMTDLILREKIGGLSPDEEAELDHYLQVEHLMRLAKTRAFHYLENGQTNAAKLYPISETDLEAI